MTEPTEESEMNESQEQPGPSTYLQASGSDWNLVTSRERYEELTDRDMSAGTAAKLRERGEFDPAKPGHRLVAEAQPLTADERLELMAHGEVLARHYRHTAMLDHAAKAGATWEQIGDVRGTSAEQGPRRLPQMSRGPARHARGCRRVVGSRAAALWPD